MQGALPPAIYQYTMNKLEQLSKTMRTRRRERKLTQEQAAELLEVSVRWYQQVERGKSRPGFSLVCELARIFQIDFADFSDKNNSI